MISFVKGLFNPTGDVSWGRFGSFLMLLFIIAWINYAIFMEKSPLLVMKEMPWMELASFVSSLYLIGKINETIQVKK